MQAGLVDRHDSYRVDVEFCMQPGKYAELNVKTPF